MTRLGNWWRYIRQRGLLAAGRALIDRFIYRSHRCIVTWNLLAGPPAPDRVGDVVFRLATPSDFDRLDELERYGRGSTHRTYVQQDNDWLFVGGHGDRIVATRRVTRVMRDSVVSRVLQLGPGQLWGADVFCLPEYRHRGIAPRLQQFGDRYLATLGYKERLGTIVVTNTPSLRMSRLSGKRPLYYVSYVRILFWERLRVSKDIPREYWDEVK
jgi:GNAT superfamily N-acetyltransferase